MKKLVISKDWIWLLLAWLLSVALVIVIPYWYLHTHDDSTPPPDPEIAEAIARRMGVEPSSWYGILCYLYYDATSPGDTLQAVHQALDRIGAWEVQYAGSPKRIVKRTLPAVEGDYMEVIVFSEENTREALYRWIFVYNEEGRLIEKKCVPIER